MRIPPERLDLDAIQGQPKAEKQPKVEKQKELREQIAIATAMRKKGEGVLSSAFVYCSKRLLAYILLFLAVSILLCLILFRRNQGQESVLLATSERLPSLPSPPLLSSRAGRKETAIPAGKARNSLNSQEESGKSLQKQNLQPIDSSNKNKPAGAAGKEASALSFPPCYTGTQNAYVYGKWKRFFGNHRKDLAELLSRYGSLARIFRAPELYINIDQELGDLHKVHFAFNLEEYEAFLDVYDPARKMDSLDLFSIIPDGSEAISYLAKNYKVHPNVIVLRLNKYKNSPLHHAAAYEDWDQFNALVDFFGDKIDFVYRDALGATAALLAIKMQRPDMAMKIFQRAHSAIFTPDNDGRTPLHYACLFGHTDLAMFLIKQGANLLEPALRSPAPVELLADTEENLQLIKDVTTHVGYNTRRAENALGNGIEVCLESKGRHLANSLGRFKAYFLGVECQTTQDTAGNEPLASKANQDRLKSSIFASIVSPELVEYARALHPLSEKSVFELILEHRSDLRKCLGSSPALSH